jgi:hypothetical protein
MKSREEIIQELIEYSLIDVNRTDLNDNYLRHVSKQELVECFKDDTDAYFKTIDDEELETWLVFPDFLKYQQEKK